MFIPRNDLIINKPCSIYDENVLCFISSPDRVACSSDLKLFWNSFVIINFDTFIIVSGTIGPKNHQTSNILSLSEDYQYICISNVKVIADDMKNTCAEHISGLYFTHMVPVIKEHACSDLEGCLYFKVQVHVKSHKILF